jgi:hypothetical protein
MKCLSVVQRGPTAFTHTNMGKGSEITRSKKAMITILVTTVSRELHFNSVSRYSRQQRKTQTGYIGNTKHKLLTTPPRQWKAKNRASGWLVSTGIYLSQQRVVGIKESWFDFRLH